MSANIWWDAVSGFDFFSIICNSLQFILLLLLTYVMLRCFSDFSNHLKRKGGKIFLWQYSVSIILVIFFSFFAAFFCILSVLCMQLSLQYLSTLSVNFTFFCYNLSMIALNMLFIFRLKFMFFSHSPLSHSISSFSYSPLVHYILFIPVFIMIAVLCTMLRYLFDDTLLSIHIIGPSVIIMLVYNLSTVWLLVLFFAKLKLVEHFLSVFDNYFITLCFCMDFYS